MSAPRVRPLRPEDAPAVEHLALPELERSPYRSGPRGAIDGLLRGTDPDARGLVAMVDGAIVGFVIHGSIAGAEGASRLQLVITAPHARRAGIARRLVEAAVDDLHGAGARFTIVELPNDPALASSAALLTATGFGIDVRVADFYRDGVDLTIYRRDNPAG